MKRVVKVLSGLALGLIWASAAAAAPVTVNFTIEVSKVDDSNHLMLGGDVKVGDLLNGAITFDSAAADGDPSSEWGLYEFQSPDAFTVFSPTPVVATDFFVQVNNGPTGDHLWVNGREVNVPNLGIAHMYMDMNDPAGSLWSSDALALRTLDASQLASLGAMFYLKMWENDNPHVLDGRLVAFSTEQPGPQPSTVPEPASMLLLGTGLIGVARLRRKRD